jgi:hypothetical protein
MSNCYLCGATPANNPLKLKESFTSHSSCKATYSDKMCDRCSYTINLRCWFWNSTKEQYSALYGRGFSWLWQGETLLSPKIEGERTEKSGKQDLTLPEVSNLATRLEMRGWLINPPEPPFRIAIAESGQKHIEFLAQNAYSRDLFPVQFELDSLIIDRKQFIKYLDAYESLLAFGFSKSEINSGIYGGDRLAQNLESYLPFELVIKKIRGSGLFRLVGHVAIASPV